MGKQKKVNSESLKDFIFFATLLVLMMVSVIYLTQYPSKESVRRYINQEVSQEEYDNRVSDIKKVMNLQILPLIDQKVDDIINSGDINNLYFEDGVNVDYFYIYREDSKNQTYLDTLNKLSIERVKKEELIDKITNLIKRGSYIQIEDDDKLYFIRKSYIKVHLDGILAEGGYSKLQHLQLKSISLDTSRRYSEKLTFNSNKHNVGISLEGNPDITWERSIKSSEMVKYRSIEDYKNEISQKSEPFIKILGLITALLTINALVTFLDYLRSQGIINKER